ncbi:MAG TPA: TIR domain-containing protein, partial [Clostridiaceae bacterium]|nr:TIR domain-containing protein [Clostridiaceae bacterium]
MEVSEQIHKRLENLRVPGSIRKATGKGKIRRVFRDQEELTVSSSLSDEILSALDESEFLIVICSPRTPESEWVSNEVSYFIK